ncbi:eukaryotic translation initiation factor 3 subunit 8 N-terminus-domain-containing protein [Halteromyces radiatus]|uniref:eukaryotic translation initiation factor 3 subunit 8 N-terminus-domain-containing protein n=1 Tax=Halteromyces radiatus TaxID=101107 RepID=UPI0022207AAA|nr:eukaryotic translation initiation factor 3 subunit 8 N-terminus-domain-containing protein [Halteromyces radiatus]KAI8093474.1 eukaryotic translation initiation factor 3 subunit 8 N-terminus-domain-containing protein [Halteromyces radiatus]
MSRFFRSTSDTESETDSSDNESFYDEVTSEEEESDVEVEEEDQQTSKKSRFLKGGDSESDMDSDEEFGRKRQVKSQKDKRLEDMHSAAKAIDNGRKNNDWTLISSEFDKLSTSISKATTGFDKIAFPKFYIKVLVELDELIQETTQKDKASKKKVNPANGKAMNATKLKVKKISKQYESMIEQYKKDPEEFMKEDEEPSTPEPIKSVKNERKPVINDISAASSAVVEDGFTSVGKGGKATAEIDDKPVLLRLREVLESRGKKNTDREEQTNILEGLLARSKSSFQKISVLLALIASRFDLTIGSTSHMDIKTWKAVEKEVNLILNIMESEPSFIVCEDAEDLDNDDKDVVPAAGEIIKLRGSIIGYIERLDDEFIKTLQATDPHTPDYIDRLRDEPSLYALLTRSQAYFEKHNLNESISRVIVRRLDHLYYKPEQVIRSIEKVSKDMLPAGVESKLIVADEPSQLIHELCAYLYKQSASMLRTRAMLCHVFHFALHNQFHKARDMLLMSHLQESIHQADVATQILYNRAVVQIGLSAFRQGLIKEAHACLQEIQGTGRAKELLAQGIQQNRYGQQQPSPELEQLERQRQLPFHMHINLELLECVFLTCSMLLEIPGQAQAGPNNKKFISRPFRRLLDFNERQAFAGPPENTRDHIMSAAKALASGEWERARDYILAIKVWDLLPDTESIKAMLVRKIQEEGLRTFLFTYASYYSTLGMAQLSSMFDLPTQTIASIIAKLIWNEELAASLDQVSQCVVLHQVELSRLQELALQFSEKAANLVDQNERLATPPNRNENQQQKVQN